MNVEDPVTLERSLEASYFIGIRKQLLSEIDKAHSNIRIAVCWFTNHDLFNAICNKVQSGINVSLIVINDRINNKISGVDFQRFVELGGNFYFGSPEKPMHNKYCIIDDKVLINGSYNWTYPAESLNEENVIIHYNNSKLCQRFTEDFERIKSNLKKVEDVKSCAITSISRYDVLGIDNYLSQDYLYQGIETDSINLINRAIEIAPDKSEMQHKALSSSMNLKMVTNADIGEKTHPDKFSVLVPKGTPIPFESPIQNFFPISETQKNVKKSIRYGSSSTASQNTEIGELDILGLPKINTIHTAIPTIFSIDSQGKLTVTAWLEGSPYKFKKEIDINYLLTLANSQ